MIAFCFEDKKLVKQGDAFRLYARGEDSFGNLYWKFVTEIDGKVTLQGQVLAALFNERSKRGQEDALKSPVYVVEDI